MKNVRENQLKKCIFMELDEYKNLINKVTDGLKEVDCEFGLFYMSTEKADETNTYWNEDIEVTLSKHFDVTVTNIHADDCDIPADDCDDVGVWICYR